jgi:hypothetical protein
VTLLGSIEKQIGAQEQNCLLNIWNYDILRVPPIKNFDWEMLNPKFCWPNFVEEQIESIPY